MIGYPQTKRRDLQRPCRLGGLPVALNIFECGSIACRNRGCRFVGMSFREYSLPPLLITEQSSLRSRNRICREEAVPDTYVRIL